MRYFKYVVKTLELFGIANNCIENICIFGSRATGLNEFDSDLDIAIQIGDIGEENSITAVWVFNLDDWQKELQEYIPYKVSLAYYCNGDVTKVACAVREHGFMAYNKSNRESLVH